MKKIHFVLALFCLTVALSLQFKKPDYLVSAAQAENYSKSFLPDKARDVEQECCIDDGGYSIPTGSSTYKCKAGTKTCDPKYCARGEYICPGPKATP